MHAVCDALWCAQDVILESVLTLETEAKAMEKEMFEVVNVERDRILEEARELTLKERLTYEKIKPRCCGAYY